GLFERYIETVSAWSKNERLRNRVTGAFEEPDEVMMKEVESLLGWQGDPSDFRRGLLSKLAAWALDHPTQRARNEEVFADHIMQLRAAVYGKLRKPIAELCRDIVEYVREQDAKFRPARVREIRAALDAMASRFGYCDHCAADAAAMLVRKRFHDLIM
ncbi:MAG: serine protein kinase PrkA, partial [Polyangiaceae bacterium]|nr:serine protein kinase PrkA [Polyangiaceae bacterium]